MGTIAAALILAIALSTSVAPAFGEPSISAKRAQAARVRTQIDVLDQQVEIAAEDYNEARTRYEKVSAGVRATEARLRVLRRRTEILQARLSGRVEGMYRTGPLTFLDVLLGARTFEELVSTWDMLRDMNADEARDVSALQRARADTARAERSLKKSQGQARSLLETMADRKRRVEGRLAERRRVLGGLESEIAVLEAEERARAAAAAQERRRRSLSSRTLFDWGDPRRAPRGGVVEVAMQYLGRPYQWAASGPYAFDCSGFTMFVYSQVGVSLPHSSRAQMDCGERVGRANLQPGDLVFFGRSRIHHVGIYVGDGRFIHSPNTGDVVSVDSLDARGDYAGACRP